VAIDLCSRKEVPWVRLLFVGPWPDEAMRAAWLLPQIPGPDSVVALAHL